MDAERERQEDEERKENIVREGREGGVSPILVFVSLCVYAFVCMCVCVCVKRLQILEVSRDTSIFLLCMCERVGWRKKQLAENKLNIQHSIFDSEHSVSMSAGTSCTWHK